MNATVPKGRAMKAKAKIRNAYSVPSSRCSKGKKTDGNTSTDASAYTKKSKYSDARPITTPTAISSGAICPSRALMRRASSNIESEGKLEGSFLPWMDMLDMIFSECEVLVVTCGGHANFMQVSAAG